MTSRCRTRRLSTLFSALALSVLTVSPASAQMLATSRPATVVRFADDAPADLEAAPPTLRQPITLKLRRVTIERALQEVMAKSGISLTYSRAVVPLDRKISVSVQDEPIVEALRQVLSGAGVELWISSEGRMALVPEPPSARASSRQTGTITGRVSAVASGEALASATVRVANSGQGATTDAQGRYAISGVPAGPHVVIAQRIGFARDSQPVTVPNEGTVTVDFTLRVLATTLSAVEVNVGYGTTTRSELTGSVASVSADQLAKAPQVSVDQALLGRAAGVQVTTSSGQPGASAAVRIRGGNSISAGNEPLYVIDGVPVTSSANETNTGTLQTQGMRGVNPLAAINPDDIESIDVLKDASATSIYGARAANGVILITTKRGQAGKNTPTIGYYYGSQEVRHKLDVLNATQFATMVNTARSNAGDVPLYTPTEIAAFGNGTNWQDVIFRKAPIQNYDLSFLGGDDDTKYFVSGGLLRQQGVVIGTNMDRGSFRLNFDQDVSKRLRFGNRVSLSRAEGNVLANGGNGNETSSIVLNALLAPPTLPVYTSSGEYFLGINNVTGRLFQNPVAAALGITNRESDTRAIGNVYGEFDIFTGLTFKSSIGADYLTSTQNYYAPSTILPGSNYGGLGSRGQLQLTTWLNENTLHYNHLFGNVHSVDLLGGLTFQQANSENVSGTAQGFNTDRLRENGLRLAQTFVGVYTGAPHSSLLSYFSRLNYGLAQKYLLTLSGRVDGSSKFGTGNQYAFFPAAALAWRASEEGFIRNLGLFDDLKVRASYGRTGNQDIGNYASLATLAGTVVAFGGTRATGFVPNSLANPDLKWESTDQFDIGLDVAVLNNRVSLTTDYYDKKTKDLLLYVPVPQTSGFTSVLKNIGSVGNHGFEVALNTVNLTGPLSWESSLNLAWNRNKVIKLGVGNEIVGLGGVGAGANQDPTILRVGLPTNSFYGWLYAGKDANGQVIYKDVNGDGTVTAADRVILGNAQPNYTGGMTNDIRFGKLALNVFIQWSVGNKIYNINRALLTTTAGDVNQLTDVLGNGRGIPTPKAGNTFETNPSDLFVEDGTYIRGKNIRLAYELPTTWFSQARLTSLSTAKVYVGVTNFFTKTDYSGFDPEINEYSGFNLTQGFDFGTYPQPRTITVGFTAGF